MLALSMLSWSLPWYSAAYHVVAASDFICGLLYSIGIGHPVFDRTELTLYHKLIQQIDE